MFFQSKHAFVILSRYFNLQVHNVQNTYKTMSFLCIYTYQTTTLFLPRQTDFKLKQYTQLLTCTLKVGMSETPPRRAKSWYKKVGSSTKWPISAFTCVRGSSPGDNSTLWFSTCSNLFVFSSCENSSDLSDKLFIRCINMSTPTSCSTGDIDASHGSPTRRTRHISVYLYSFIFRMTKCYSVLPYYTFSWGHATNNIPQLLLYTQYSFLHVNSPELMPTHKQLKFADVLCTK